MICISKSRRPLSSFLFSKHSAIISMFSTLTHGTINGLMPHQAAEAPNMARLAAVLHHNAPRPDSLLRGSRKTAGLFSIYCAAFVSCLPSPSFSLTMHNWRCGEKTHKRAEGMLL